MNSRHRLTGFYALQIYFGWCSHGFGFENKSTSLILATGKAMDVKRVYFETP